MQAFVPGAATFAMGSAALEALNMKSISGVTKALQSMIDEICDEES